ncbi:MAG: ParA family protein [Candidatus Nomurabacteria bacterium]|nr:MAG: ParA family protein [Candidatus Nomurabacteria bacterium]
MARIISIVNQKGGVGKTTTAINLGAYLAHYGARVLLIDLDPQANATSGLGIKHRELERGVYETLLGAAALSEIIQPTAHDRYHIAPATVSLAGANVELVNMDGREGQLDRAIPEIAEQYDYVLIDNPPSLGMLTINGLTAAREVLIPVQCEYLALEGLSQLLETIQLVKESIQPNVEVLGAVLTMYDSRYKLSDAVLQELYRYFPNRIFRTVIPRNVHLAEAPSHGRPILKHDPDSRGARAYSRLAREVLSPHHT